MKLPQIVCQYNIYKCNMKFCHMLLHVTEGRSVDFKDKPLFVIIIDYARLMS